MFWPKRSGSRRLQALSSVIFLGGAPVFPGGDYAQSDRNKCKVREPLGFGQLVSKR